MKSNKNRRIALVGVMSALAIALSFLESLLPPIPNMPPGAKPGFSNIPVMASARDIGLFETIFITCVKSIFVFATRGATAFFMSFSGGIFSCITVYFLFRLKSRPFGYIGIGIISAIMHNLGQLIASALIMGTATFYYAPFLLIFSLITGTVTGTILGRINIKNIIKR